MKREYMSYRWLAIIFILIFIANSILVYYEGYKFGLLWFCSTLLLVFAIALLTNNKLLLSSVAVSATVIEIVWSIDALSFLITNEFIFGVAKYFATASLVRKILTMYHVLLLIMPIVIVIKKKEFSKYAWIVSSLNLLIVLLLGLIFNAHNINCTQDFCNLNIESLQNVPKTNILLMSGIIWGVITFLVFVPTNIFFYLLIKKYIDKHRRYENS